MLQRLSCNSILLVATKFQQLRMLQDPFSCHKTLTSCHVAIPFSQHDLFSYHKILIFYDVLTLFLQHSPFNCHKILIFSHVARKKLQQSGLCMYWCMYLTKAIIQIKYQNIESHMALFLLLTNILNIILKLFQLTNKFFPFHLRFKILKI